MKIEHNAAPEAVADGECEKCVGTGTIQTTNDGPPSFGFKDCPSCIPTTQKVVVRRADLEEVRDLLMERIYGSNARSPGHNARLAVEAMLAAAPAPSSQAGGEGALASIADSLKRIADTLDGTAAGVCVSQTIFGGRRDGQ